MYRLLSLLILTTLTTLMAFVEQAVAQGGQGHPRGLNPAAQTEIQDAGVDKYLGDFTPESTADVGDGWTKHTFDPDGGDGPICIAGTPFSAFTREGNPTKLLIFLQGGGACWQDFYNCHILVENNALPPFAPTGIWEFDSADNPLADYSVVYVPYCDGSVFTGDNDVADGNFPFGPVRFHRGLRNLSATMDLATAQFPHARKILLAGSAAGGHGVSQFAPFLARFLYGNQIELSVFNDAGKFTPFNPDEDAAVAARAADWQFEQFYPASCVACSSQSTEIIKWRLDNDRTIREAYYSTDGDLTNRFFNGLLGSHADYRALILSAHDPINDAHPGRYKRFIVSGDDSHTALQSQFFTAEANGVLLNDWTSDFLVLTPFWVDIVEDFVSLF